MENKNNLTEENNDKNYKKELNQAIKQKEKDEKWLQFAQKHKLKIYILSALLFIVISIISTTKTISLFLSVISYVVFTINFSILVLKKEADIITFNSERLCFVSIFSFGLSVILLLF